MDSVLRGREAPALPANASRAHPAADIRARTGAGPPDAVVLAAALEMEGRQPGPVTVASFDHRLTAARGTLSRAA